MIGIKHANDSRNARFSGPAPWIASKRDAPCSSSVIGAIPRHDLVASREEAGDLDRVFVRFCATVGEEEGVDVAGRNLGEFGAKSSAGLGRHEWIGIAQSGRLLADGANHALVAVPDVDRHQLTVEIDETLPLRRPEVDPLRLGHRNRIDLRLSRPLKQSVLLGEINNLLARHRRIRNCSSHGVLITND